MKLAKVRIPYRDIEQGIIRNVGDTFLCEDNVGEHLQSMGLVWAVAPHEEKIAKAREKVTNEGAQTPRKRKKK